MKTMTEPLGDAPPPEELELAVEEHLGRPMAGAPSERMAALTQRIAYLEQQIQLVWKRVNHDSSRVGEIQEELMRLQEDMREAGNQLAEWKLQFEERN
jgi:chromosome segregation ATPase